MLTDDLPWPELGNVSRGATRGNQGQKGILGPPDRDGRCVLQLRVQPGVLAVRLNRQSSDWYRLLDSEVNRALKLTKTYWRKARRRQDYDARADQDHMELHEWLQQLKDKTMTHLELLMQKGDIQGPPYTMSDNIELTFLRKFIERQAAGIPHNPRLRRIRSDQHSIIRDPSTGSPTPEPSERTFITASDIDHPRLAGENAPENSSTKALFSSRNSLSPSSRHLDSVMQEANTSRQALLSARESLARAQKETQDAFLIYTACLETERQARQEVSAAEKQRDDIMAAILVRSKSTESTSRQSSVSAEEHQSPTIYHRDVGERSMDRLESRSDLFLQKLPGHSVHDFRHPMESTRLSGELNKTVDWSEGDGRGLYADESASHIEDPSNSRKHSRVWDRDQIQDGRYTCEDIATPPPRKRIHHMMGNFDALSNVALQSQGLALSS